MNATNRRVPATSQHHPRTTVGLSEIDTGCCAPDCSAPSLEDAPFSICTAHYIEIARHWDSQKADFRSLGEKAPAVPEPALAPLGCVYFLRLGDRVKIGHTRDLRRRRREVPHDELLAAIPGGQETERDWHRRFDHLRWQGEWFAATPELLEAIRQS